MERKDDPQKFCCACGKPLVRKRFNGRLEDRTRFLRRMYCDERCMAEGMRVESPAVATHRKRAAMLRGAACEQCGSTANLHAHHRDEDPSNNAPENVATLCGSCHLKWHWQHGKKAKPRPACSVCGEPARKLGLCGKHHQRLKKYGDPRLTKRKVGAGFVLVREE